MSLYAPSPFTRWGDINNVLLLLYVILLSASEQTHYALVACNSD